jgi:hypothetical protein
MCRCFGTLSPTFIGLVHIKFKCLGITQKKYTTFTTWQKFEIKKEYGLSEVGHKRLKHPGVTTNHNTINKLMFYGSLLMIIVCDNWISKAYKNFSGEF